MKSALLNKIIKELMRRPVEYNRFRVTSGPGRSQTFGVVKRRFRKVKNMYDYSSQCYKRPYLYKLLLDFANENTESICDFNSIQVNQSYECKPHYDKGNVGNSTIIAFGQFTGGELVMDGSFVDIKQTFITANFSNILHYVAPVRTGVRYSVVFFKTPVKKSLPKPSVRFENNKYYFYRGNVKIIYRTWREKLKFKKNVKVLP